MAKNNSQTIFIFLVVSLEFAIYIYNNLSLFKSYYAARPMQAAYSARNISQFFLLIPYACALVVAVITRIRNNKLFMFPFTYSYALSLLFFFFFLRQSSCATGRSAVARSWLTLATPCCLPG